MQIEKETGVKSVNTGRFYSLEKLAINFQEHLNIIEDQLAFSDHNRDLYQAFKNILPISVENHGYVCLDYRNSLIAPSVVYFYDEDFVDYYIASNFDDFLNKLMSID
ncbi:SMI1/KNR4 family protein [Paenibacillus sp. WST5]|uniref:SMI1/KNR4 family protein n=1 Tax=Paenibacillus sedimenti TaxID=2770274 RepID=A0A926KWW9_9BACL|nr:SMI1/KNR4 family protein [Paenibacillus sedimenti]